MGRRQRCKGTGCVRCDGHDDAGRRGVAGCAGGSPRGGGGCGADDPRQRPSSTRAGFRDDTPAKATTYRHRSRGPELPDGARSLVLIVDDPDAPDPGQPANDLGPLGALRHPGDGRRARRGRRAGGAAARHPRGPQRLEANRLRRSLPADRPPPLLPQALRPRHRARRSRRRDQGRGRARDEGPRARRRRCSWAPIRRATEPPGFSFGG